MKVFSVHNAKYNDCEFSFNSGRGDYGKALLAIAHPISGASVVIPGRRIGITFGG
jgi:hypothetical protein